MGWKCKTTYRITRGNRNNQKMNIYYQEHMDNARLILFIWVSTAHIFTYI